MEAIINNVHSVNNGHALIPTQKLNIESQWYHMVIEISSLCWAVKTYRSDMEATGMQKLTAPGRPRY